MLEKQRQRILERIQNFRLMDDAFMSKFFENDLECTSLLLQIILNNPDIKAIESVSQSYVKNLQGRSICLDIKATDASGRIFNVEVQRKDNGANPRRARYHRALIDANLILPGENLETIPETYVIFITEHDVINASEPLYYIDRVVKQTGMDFNDGAHIIYVNGEYRGQNLIGDLMHDFNSRKPSEMKLKTLATRAKYLKETEKGVTNMWDAVKDLVDEIVEENKEDWVSQSKKETQIETAKRLFSIGLTAEQVSAGTGLSLAEVQELAHNSDSSK